MFTTFTLSTLPPLLPEAAVEFLKKRAREATGLTLMAIAGAFLTALATYAPGDPSFNAATSIPARNSLGQPGAIIADLALQLFGLAAWLPGGVMAIWGARMVLRRGLGRGWLRLVALLVALYLAAVAASAVVVPDWWPLAARLGGAIGTLTMNGVVNLGRAHGLAVEPWMVATVAALLGLLGLVTALGLSVGEWLGLGRLSFAGAVLAGRGTARAGEGARSLWRRIKPTRPEAPGDPDRPHIGEELMRKRAADVAPTAPDIAAPAIKPDQTQDIVPGRALVPVPRVKPAVEVALDHLPAMPPMPKDLVAPKAAGPKPGNRALATLQPRLDLGDGTGETVYRVPPLDLLAPPKPLREADHLDKDALEQNARMLSQVLEDFGVRGRIVKVRPGPVITLYELEPAPGTKTSRVIGLADDIARSMSALSVRVAVVPGRNVIGIEMPNRQRETVYLREMLASEEFERNGGKLVLALGKDISGAPVLTDLARMPHLLIAGTTGSGKSVAVNTMILSLLYRLSPQQCRLIMIDPKMLELSVYEGIPHLLAPVVTEPGKAVVALKWTVREMEERYRAMSQMGVRNIAGYNKRLEEVRASGESLTRRVQTGFDPESGQPVFEDQPLPTDPLPNIVVVVDEMADLMLVAGKEIEGAVQRLAQMARAAGIHLIMATQRPSVDVITGTIKANFPTRISFQVTSKIDSRTILGEQGAEQLLGQGDMLYMAGGGRITRVHGPFVADDEVEEIVSFLKQSGEPQYVEAVTEEVEEGADVGAGAEDGGSGDDLYDQAVALVAREGKASTSFVQRHLQIGYNRAARLVERMETEGVVSKANRVGRREVLAGSTE